MKTRDLTVEDVTARPRESEPPFSTKLQPLRALRALATLAENPDDTAQVFTIIEALSGGSPLRNLARFRARAEGRRLLAERPALLALLADRAALQRMPEGSLGRAYVAFLEREGITADGLVQASLSGAIKSAKRGSDLEYMRARLRDSHDLWHTVTGWHGDVLGEVSLLAFNVAQLRNPGVAMIVLSALLRARSPQLLRLALHSFTTGLRAEWLAVVHWESLMAEPLEQVRATLGIEPAPSYVQLRSKDMGPSVIREAPFVLARLRQQVRALFRQA